MLTVDQYAGSTVFRYTAPQGNSGEELAIFFGSLENSDGGGYYALVLKTEYGSMGSFLDESKKGSLRGTVTAVRYIGFNDMLHSSNNISALASSGKASRRKGQRNLLRLHRGERQYFRCGRRHKVRARRRGI